MGYCSNCLDGPVLKAVPEPLLTEFGIHHRLESCVRKINLILYEELGGLTFVKLNSNVYTSDVESEEILLFWS